LKKILLICLILVINLSSKDFYYSFIKSDKSQISEYDKKNILSGNYKLQTIKRLIREGQLEDAYKRILKFREKNKIKLLDSTAILIYSDILYKKGGTTNGRKAVTLLEQSINNSTLHRGDLLEAYKLLVLLNLKINKPKDAVYYAKSIGETFDDPMSKAFSKIALAQIDIYQRRYKKAIRVLYKILVQTRDIKVATVVADELYDVYILDKQDKKAYNLVQKVLSKNIQYYANDSYLALKKVDKLIKANMPEFAIKILKMLLDKAIEPKSIDRFKFKLANTYMRIAGKNTKYMLKAKELYKDLLARKKKIIYYKEVRMALDEILMREGKLIPSKVAEKYYNSESMSQKTLLQELLNYVKEKKYGYIQKIKKVYKGISNTTAQRFGYKNITKIFDEINAQMIKFYLNNNKCIELSEVLYLVSDGSIKDLIKNKRSRDKFFDCLSEVPDARSYKIVKQALEKTKDSNVYFSLEKIALLLNKVDDAYEYVQKIDMLNDDKIKQKEFLYRFMVYGKLNSTLSIKQFFRYTNKHPDYIEINDNNPMIIDFYYQYYLFLQENKKDIKALEILHKLYNKQKSMKAYVYSPFVELELSKEAKLDDNYTKALIYLKSALENMRKISPNDYTNIYYEMAKLYEKLDKKERYKDIIFKCKNIKGATNMYKKMCDKL